MTDHDIALCVGSQREVGHIHKQFLTGPTQDGRLDCSPIGHHLIGVDRVADLTSAEQIGQQSLDLQVA